MEAPSAATTARDALNARYAEAREECDERAKRYKDRRLRMWFGSLFATWAPLVLAIVGLSGRLPREWNQFLLHAAIPTLGMLNFCITVLQVMTSPRARWLAYRAATERLREEAMRFRMERPPYDGPDAEKRFGTFLDDLNTRLGRVERPSGFGRLRGVCRGLAFWRLHAWKLFAGRVRLVLAGLPEDIRTQVPHPPDEGLFPRAGECKPAERVVLIRHRIRNQRRWHLAKAGKYYGLYLLFQALMAGLSLFIAAYSYAYGQSFEWYGVATAVSLSVIAWRDFLEYAPLSMRYFQLAQSLAELEGRLDQAVVSAAGEDAAAALGKVLDEVERQISSDFRSWKVVVQEMVPTD